MQKANGRQRQNSYRFKARTRDVADDSRFERSTPTVKHVAEKKAVPLKSTELKAVSGSHNENQQGSSNTKDSSIAATSLRKPPARPFTKHDQPPPQWKKYNPSIHNLHSKENNTKIKDTDAKSSSNETTCEIVKHEDQNKYGLVSEHHDSIDPAGWQVQGPKNKTRTNSKPFSKSVAELPSGLDSERTKQNHAVASSSRSAFVQRERFDNINMSRSVEEEKNVQVNQSDNSKKKKKKKTPISKEERRVKREEAVLTELYKPKDSHVSILTPELFQRLKGDNSLIGTFSKEGLEEAANFRFCSTASSSSISDFPSLNCSVSTSPKSSGKSFAKAVTMPPSLPPTITAVPSIIPSPSVIDNATITENSSAGGSVKQPKLSKRPITIALGDLIDLNKCKQSTARKQISKRYYDNFSIIRENPKVTVGNCLDSSGPIVILRGKIRDKKKKPSNLKKCILHGRQLRKTLLMVSDCYQCYHDDPIVDPPPKLENQTTPNTKTSYSLNLASASDTDEKSKSILLHSINNNKENENPPSVEKNEKTESIFRSLLEEAELEATSKAPPIPESIKNLIKLQMHSRKFRQYCDMFVSKELHGEVMQLMKELHRLQDRIYKTDPKKLPTKRRYVNGIKEVTNAIKLNKVQMVIMAPDIEPNEGEGGLDEKIIEIIADANERQIPCIFSGNRFILGIPIRKKKSPVSVMAVLDKQSVEEQFNKVVEHSNRLREQYQLEFDKRVQDFITNG